MKTLGANCIRVHHVDPTANHTGCMAAFAAVGIYLLVNLDTFTAHIYPQPVICLLLSTHAQQSSVLALTEWACLEHDPIRGGYKLTPQF
jgi:hypothetical protein